MAIERTCLGGEVLFDSFSFVPLATTINKQRLSEAGAYLTTAESIVFMLTKSADHPQFRTISTLIKEHAKGENPFANTAHF